MSQFGLVVRGIVFGSRRPELWDHYQTRANEKEREHDMGRQEEHILL